MAAFDTLTVRYDPVNHTVTGLFNGIPIGTLPYTAAGINYVGFEAAATVRRRQLPRKGLQLTRSFTLDIRSIPNAWHARRLHADPIRL